MSVEVSKNLVCCKRCSGACTGGARGADSYSSLRFNNVRAAIMTLKNNKVVFYVESSTGAEDHEGIGRGDKSRYSWINSARDQVLFAVHRNSR